MRELVNSLGVPGSPMFAQAVKAGPTIYVSGLVGVDVRTGKPAGPTIQEQTRQALTNCETVLHAAGATLDDVVEVGILLSDPDHFAGMNEEYGNWFPVDPPARYAAKLGAEIPGILVSIRMTAYVG
jgi:2-iminobutanoate/2-iminopropanoate deaminase